MELEKALEIIKQHQKWRQDNNVPSKYEPVNPTELGIALDYAITILKDKLKE